MKNLAKLTLISLYLVILAGAVVRGTGSGMGCPDWPKCFGFIIPPSERAQLEWSSNNSFQKGQMIIHEEALWKANNTFTSGNFLDLKNWSKYTKHDYAVFNPTHTWIEYINRLFGALSGVFAIFTFVLALIQGAPKRIRWLSAIVVILIGVNGYLGAKVVETVLMPGMITIHMLLAVVLIAFSIALVRSIGFHGESKGLNKNRWVYYLLLGIVIQIVIGTMLRENIDFLKSDGVSNKLWFQKLPMVVYLHIILAYLFLLLSGYKWYKWNKGNHPLRKQLGGVVLVLLVDYLSGMAFRFFDFPFLSQPVHLVAAIVVFGQLINLILNLKWGSQLQKAK